MSACPFCRGLIEDAACARCGSLEGLLPDEAPSTSSSGGDGAAGGETPYSRLLNRTGRTFGFDWAGGFVSPFRPAPDPLLEAALGAIHTRLSGGLGPGGLLVDLGCG